MGKAKKRPVRRRVRSQKQFLLEYFFKKNICDFSSQKIASVREMGQDQVGQARLRQEEQRLMEKIDEGDFLHKFSKIELPFKSRKMFLIT